MVDVWDVKTLWWYTYGEAYEESHYPTAAHQFYWRRHTSLPHVNCISSVATTFGNVSKDTALCLANVYECRNIRIIFAIQCNISSKYLHSIESAGLQVTEDFRMPEIVNDAKVYSQYNYHTMTGRPSNAFRGFNFAAMNKEDGTRAAFCSRFEKVH
jgi:hypothetical protein